MLTLFDAQGRSILLTRSSRSVERGMSLPGMCFWRVNDEHGNFTSGSVVVRRDCVQRVLLGDGRHNSRGPDGHPKDLASCSRPHRFRTTTCTAVYSLMNRMAMFVQRTV